MDTKTAWDEQIGLGYDGLDREHGLQLHLLETLERAVADGGDPAAQEVILRQLLDYSDVHFGSEELLMRLHSYPRYGVHVEEHRRLLDQLNDIRTRDLRQGRGLAVVQELRAWLRGHIQGMDRDFAEHVTGDLPPPA